MSSAGRTRDMANTEKNEAPGDVELGNRQKPEANPPAPPTVLEHARLGNLDLFRSELESGNHPLDFKAGRAVYFNRTPLHLAAMEGHLEIVEFILSHQEISREVVNAKDGFGYTPLHLAVRHSHKSVVRLLTTSSLVLPDRFLAATSQPDDLCWRCGGYTPLHLAAASGQIAIAKLLLRQPCQMEFAYDPVNLRAVTWNGKTPLELAQYRFYPSFSDHLWFYDKLSLFSHDKAQRRNYVKLVRLLADSNWRQQYRESTAMAANAILVGSALIVAASFGSLLQPPGGIPAPNSGALSSSLFAFGSAYKYWNSVFYICNAFAFSLSVVALVIGTVTALPGLELTSQDDVFRLRNTVRIAQQCLFVAVLFLLFCFSFAGSIVLHNFATIYGTNTYYVVTWLPVITFVYVVYFFGAWACKSDPYCQGYSMKLQVRTICFALFYGLTFIVARLVKK